MIDGNKTLVHLEQMIGDTKAFPQIDYVTGVLKGLETAALALRVQIEFAERKQALLDIYVVHNG